MMRPTLLFAVSLILSANAFAAVYKWVDEHGNVVYSDTPRPGATPVEILPGPAPKPVPAPKQPAAEPAAAQQPPAAPAQQADDFKGYDTLAILAPEHDTAVRSNNGALDIKLKVEPELDPKHKHRIRVLLDAKAFGETQEGAEFTLPNIDRGTHTLQVEILDEQGQSLKRSEPVTFHLLRHSVLFNHPGRKGCFPAPTLPGQPPRFICP